MQLSAAVGPYTANVDDQSRIVEIERDVKAEIERDPQRLDVDRRLRESYAEEEEIGELAVAQYARDRRDFYVKAGAFGGTFGAAVGVLATSAPWEVGRKLRLGGIGLAIGAVAVPGIFRAMEGLLEGFMAGVTNDRNPRYGTYTPELQARREALWAERKEIRKEWDQLPHSGAIRPGQAWHPVSSASSNDDWIGADRAQTITTSGWVKLIMTGFDHNRDGAIALGGDATGPANELTRSIVGGPFSSGDVTDPARRAKIDDLSSKQITSIDSNRNGLVSEQEIDQALAKARTIAASTGVSVAALRRYDTDQSGSVDVEEIARGLVRDGIPKRGR